MSALVKLLDISTESIGLFKNRRKFFRFRIVPYSNYVNSCFVDFTDLALQNYVHIISVLRSFVIFEKKIFANGFRISYYQTWRHSDWLLRCGSWVRFRKKYWYGNGVKVVCRVWLFVYVTFLFCICKQHTHDTGI